MNDKGTKRQKEGGFVANGAYVSQHAFVGPEAQVCGSASVEGHARVYGKAIVRGEAVVSDDARVYGNAIVEGSAIVRRKARVSGHASIGGEAVVEGDAVVRGFARISEGVVDQGVHAPPISAGEEARLAAERAEREARARREAEKAERRRTAEDLSREVVRMLEAHPFNFGSYLHHSTTWRQKIEVSTSGPCHVSLKTRRSFRDKGPWVDDEQRAELDLSHGVEKVEFDVMKPAVVVSTRGDDVRRDYDSDSLVVSHGWVSTYDIQAPPFSLDRTRSDLERLQRKLEALREACAGGL